MSNRGRRKPRQYRGHTCSDEALMRSARMESARAAQSRPPAERRYPLDPADELVIVTDPGCHPSMPTFELHVLEVLGAQMALDMRGGVGWADETLMDCGCVLAVRRLGELQSRTKP